MVEVTFADEAGAALDRDVVVRWPAALPEPSATLDLARPSEDRAIADSTYGLLTIVPPTGRLHDRTLPRDLILLLDTSGSMSGDPLRMAKMVVLDIIDSLSEADTLEIIEFSNEPRRWRRGPVAGSADARADAGAWIRALEAGGATEMVGGVRAALAPRREGARRQVIIVTDGLIGFERQVIADIRDRLPRGCRVHTVGIGSAANRSLTAAVARAGCGGEIIVSLDDDARAAAARLVARTAKPIVVDFEVTGGALIKAVGPHADLAAGAPVLICVRLKPQGGELIARGTTRNGPWEQRLTVPAWSHGEGSESVVTLFGRELVEDLELDAATGKRVERSIEQVGLDFQIATRLTSWVAVCEEPGVDPREPLRTVRIPQEVPYGMSVEGLGLRGAVLPDATLRAMHRSFPSTQWSMVESPIAPQCSLDFDASCLDFDEPPRQQASAPTRVMRGRIASHCKGRLIVLIDPAELFYWSAAYASVEPLDGSPQVVRIDEKHTTREGAYRPGQEIRLVLLGVDIPKDQIRAIRVMCNEEPLRIEL